MLFGEINSGILLNLLPKFDDICVVKLQFVPSMNHCNMWAFPHRFVDKLIKGVNLSFYTFELNLLLFENFLQEFLIFVIQVENRYWLKSI